MSKHVNQIIKLASKVGNLCIRYLGPSSVVFALGTLWAPLGSPDMRACHLTRVDVNSRAARKL